MRDPDRLVIEDGEADTAALAAYEATRATPSAAAWRRVAR